MPLVAGVDYSPFLTAGVPIGGMTSGSAQQKTNAQARLWGGKPGVPFDPNVRTPPWPCWAPGLRSPGTYAMSIDGVNGVPAVELRHRTAMGP